MNAKFAKFLTKIGFPPHNQIIHGNFSFYGDKNLKMPDKCAIEGNCTLSDVSITSWPSDCTVRGDMDIRNLSDSSKLPNHLCVQGNLTIVDTNTPLPNSLYVAGNLNMMNSTSSKLPDFLEVKGYLDVRDTNITEIPDRASIDRIIVSPQQHLKLPDNFDKSKVFIQTGFMTYEPCPELYLPIQEAIQEPKFCVSVVGPCGLTNENQYKSLKECIDEISTEHIQDFVDNKRIDILDENGHYAASCSLSPDSQSVNIFHYNTCKLEILPLDTNIVNEIQNLQSASPVADMNVKDVPVSMKDDMEI